LTGRWGDFLRCLAPHPQGDNERGDLCIRGFSAHDIGENVDGFKYRKALAAGGHLADRFLNGHSTSFLEEKKVQTTIYIFHGEKTFPRPISLPIVYAGWYNKNRKYRIYPPL
jgi:hypothetical protein